MADVFYLGFYPLAYVATVQLLRTALGRLSRPNWLDGVVAGLGRGGGLRGVRVPQHRRTPRAAALATAVTNLAYPIGDLLLLSLVDRWHGAALGTDHVPWFLLAAGISLNVIGDTFNLFSSTASSVASRHRLQRRRLAGLDRAACRCPCG